MSLIRGKKPLHRLGSRKETSSQNPPLKKLCLQDLWSICWPLIQILPMLEHLFWAFSEYSELIQSPAVMNWREHFAQMTLSLPKHPFLAWLHQSVLKVTIGRDLKRKAEFSSRKSTVKQDFVTWKSNSKKWWRTAIIDLQWDDDIQQILSALMWLWNFSWEFRLLYLDRHIVHVGRRIWTGFLFLFWLMQVHSFHLLTK